jgi:hypothetical protein
MVYYSWTATEYKHLFPTYDGVQEPIPNLRWCTGTYSEPTMVYRKPIPNLRWCTGTYSKPTMVYRNLFLDCNGIQALIPNLRWCTGTLSLDCDSIQAPITERWWCTITRDEHLFLHGDGVQAPISGTATVYRQLFLERRRCTGTYFWTATVYTVQAPISERRWCTVQAPISKTATVYRHLFLNIYERRWHIPSTYTLHIPLRYTLYNVQHKVRTYKEYDSVCLRRNWDFPPTPHPQASVPPPPCFWGEGNTRWRERGWESPNSDEGHTLWYSLYVRTLWCTVYTVHYTVPFAVLRVPQIFICRQRSREVLCSNGYTCIMYVFSSGRTRIGEKHRGRNWGQYVHRHPIYINSRMWSAAFSPVQHTVFIA